MMKIDLKNGKKLIKFFGSFTKSLKVQMVVINSIIMVIVLAIATIVAMTTSIGNVNLISGKVKNSLILTLDEKLKKAAVVSTNIIEDKKKNLLKEANMIGNAENVISLILYGYTPMTNTITAESFRAEGGAFVMDYKQSESLLAYIQLANKMKKIMYESGDAPQQIEIIDKLGEIKAVTSGLAEGFKEQSGSETVKQLQSTAGLTMTTMVAAPDGIAIKAYGRINKGATDSSEQGILAVTQPIDVIFADELKKVTDNEVVIYNGTQPLVNTLFLEFEEEKDVYQELTKKEEGKKFVLKTKKLKVQDQNGKEIEKEYRFVFTPILNSKQEQIGMVALGSETKDVQTAIAEFNKSKAMMTATILGILIVVAIISVIVAMVFIYMYSGRIVAQIKKILKVVDKVAAGDLTHKLEVKSEDELGELGNGINTMVDSLEKIVCQITTTSETMASSTEEILATSETNKDAMQGIVRISNDIQNKTNEEMHKIKEAVDFIAQINAGIKEIASYSEKVTAKSHESSEIAKDGGNAVKDAIESITNIKKTVEDTANIADILQEKTDVIEKVITVITGIAEQTNLLALNAAIEAARAGEVGKGFAVVATEVKKLANQSAEAAEEIRKIILGIKQEAINVNKSVDRGIEEVEKGVAISKKAREALENIIKSVYETTEMVTEITASTQEQSASTEESMKIMEQLSKEAENTSKTAKEISEAAKDRLVGVQEIVIGVNTILQSAEQLSGMVDIFKTSECVIEDEKDDIV